jgi:hypothetical protein
MSLDDLDTFAPAPATVTVRGRSFHARPVRLREIPAFTRALVEVLPLVLADRMIDVVIHKMDAARAMVVAGLRIEDPAWLDDLDAAEFLELMTPVVEVNLDFFVHRTLPGVRNLNARILQQVGMPPDGAPSSPGSPAADTPSTPAST